MIKDLLLCRNFARKSAVELEGIMKKLGRQAEYTDEEKKFHGGKGDGNTSLSGSRQVA